MKAPGRTRDWRWLAASGALHAVGIAILLRIAIEPGGFLFREPAHQPIAPTEKLSYVPLIRPSADSARAMVPGGDNRKASPNVSIGAPLRAPVTVPSTLPPAPRVHDQLEDPAGSGPLIGGGGPLRGVQPAYGDGRVWPVPGPIVAAAKTDDQRRDSTLQSRLARYRDSLNLAGNSEIAAPPPSWLYTTKGGQQWGIDKNTIKLGKFSLPSGVLYALPLAKMERDISRDRESNLRQADMDYAVRRGVTEEQFRAAVKAIRERKDREKREADEQKRQQQPATPVVTQGTN